MSQRQAVTKKKALAFRSADRAGKSQILDLTGQLEALAQAKGRTHHTPHAETG